jgi:hypothetical protein
MVCAFDIRMGTVMKGGTGVVVVVQLSIPPSTLKQLLPPSALDNPAYCPDFSIPLRAVVSKRELFFSIVRLT